jgi:uncharacterized protein YkwD
VKDLGIGLGRLPYIRFLLLLLVSVWTTPAFSMAGNDGVVVSLGDEKVIKKAAFIESAWEHSYHSPDSIFPFFTIANPINECPSTFEEQVIHFINRERNLAGLPSLELDVRLQTAARWMSHDMATGGKVPADHVDSLGRTFDVRILEEGVYPYIHLGEVIAGGFSSPEAVVKAWMNSPGHKARLLDANYEHIGIGHAYDLNTDHWYYWTADLGSTLESRQSPSLKCDPAFYFLFLSLIKK